MKRFYLFLLCVLAVKSMLVLWYHVLWMMSYHLPCLCPVCCSRHNLLYLNQWNISVIRKNWIVHFILSVHLYFSWAWWLMKMEKKRRTRCKHFLLFECFENNKKSQLPKYCIKCLEKPRQQTKCEHWRERSHCIFCDGSQICEHKKRRSICIFCGGSQISEDRRQRSSCPTCDPLGYLIGVVRACVCTALKNNKDTRRGRRVQMGSTEYLGCNMKIFKKHIEQ